jgi:hypothetical protein
MPTEDPTAKPSDIGRVPRVFHREVPGCDKSDTNEILLETQE